MSEWRNININKTNIKHETTKAVLIAMPHNSNYDGYTFWHPLKLVRRGRHKAAVSISYTDDFQFNLKKTKKNSYEVISEKTISVAEFEQAFETVDACIVGKSHKNPYETHKPQAKEPENKEAMDELKDE